jgi:hypothetical protein
VRSITAFFSFLTDRSLLLSSDSTVPPSRLLKPLQFQPPILPLQIPPPTSTALRTNGDRRLHRRRLFLRRLLEEMEERAAEA